MIYSSKENDILISVAPRLEPTQSSIEHSYFFYEYQVSITNHREEDIQLESRYWRIKDGAGVEDIVEGEGVIGKKPLLRPGETFQYTSYCPLRTKTGNMRGHYLFKSAEGVLKANVPLFFLRPDQGEELSEL